MTVSIRPETHGDVQAIREVNRSAFGSDVEANLVDALRDGGFALISLVAEQDDQVIGHILFSPLMIQTVQGETDSVALAPMCVLPRFQRTGIGSQLVRDGIAKCIDLGHESICVLGHPDFYQRFGFQAKLAASLENPFGSGEPWMAIELTPGALAGVSGKVQYTPPFLKL